MSLFIALAVVVSVLAGIASARRRAAGTGWNRGFDAASIGASIVGVAALLMVYYRWVWHDLQTFAVFIDTCPALFCDFDHHFYPQGQSIASSTTPAPGYFYSAPFALLLGSFAGVPLEQAHEYWGVLQALFTAALFAIPLLCAPDIFAAGPRRAALYTLAFAVSVPVLHNFKWGQVSVIVTAAVLLSLWLSERGHSAAAGLLLAVAITTKYYPVVFLAHSVVHRQWRTVMSAVAWTAAFILLTVAVLGLEPTIQFQARVQQALQSEQRWIAKDPNSQYVAYLPLRWWPEVGARNVGLTTWLGYAVCAMNVALLWVARTRHRSAIGLWTCLLLFTTVPFWVPTSWPHYFVYLPVLQVFVWHDLHAARDRGRFEVVGWGLLAASVVSSSSLVLLQVATTWSGYSYPGYLFASNACLLLYAYLRLLPQAVSAV